MPLQDPLGPQIGGDAATLNITAATVVKSVKGRLCAINVLVDGSTTGAAYDNNSTSTGNTAAHQIAVIPETTTTAPIVYNWPCATGIVVVPGTGQTLSVSFA